MNTEYQSSVHTVHERQSRRKSGPSVLVFLCVWVVLIGTGILGAIWYSGKIKESITTEVGQQTSQKITAMQTSYEAQLKQLDTQFREDIAKLQGKVDALNELLEFSKDNASSKTDNSNKLFTQLSEVKKQLNELKKDLDVLK
ncbi:hypothetical protein [Paenibacillus spongiae]|uniref:Uncharacterized protein n=1 Tax=Paenibacillus spongiae TaxID=2909671 RepID=A0ABY5SG19_9BACL|nr:hypothetical protein [Paenibacillus spongiae]UVI31677.1 hypothetical protein L1F29_07630 [Paenibacillus spongiae]